MYGGGRRCFVLFSDDRGASWRAGGDFGVDATEWAAAPVDAAADGTRLLASVRGKWLRRMQAWSDDGGESWGPLTTMWALPEPLTGCEGALARHPNGNLYYSHPAASWPPLRNVMAVLRSADGGATWQPHTTLWGDGAQDGAPSCMPPCVPAASYSSLAVLGEGASAELGILFMRNNVSMLVFEGRGVSFMRFAP